MSDKPSLYVVEKREVVILVVLFVLVTVLAFTMGVRYGESVGKKAALEQREAEAAHGGGEAETLGGTLGSSGHGDAAKENGHDAKNGERADHGDAAASHDEKAEPGKEGKDESKPEVAAKGGADHDGEGAPPAKEAADKNSDETLLNALKEAGVEPPGGKTVGNAKLPAQVKAPREREAHKLPSGSFVIQVGSHPTRAEAETQLRLLAAKRVHAEILAPFKDRQGEWHRVVIGSFKTKREAEREAIALKGRRAILSFFVWRLP